MSPTMLRILLVLRTDQQLGYRPFPAPAGRGRNQPVSVLRRNRPIRNWLLFGRN